MRSVPEHVRQVVETGLGRSVQSCTRPTGGRVAETYLLELDGPPGRAVCKFGGSSVRTGDVVEPLVCRLVSRTTTVPAPSVLASGRLAGGGRWALYEHRAGESPTPFSALAPRVRRRAVRETGAALAQLHATHQFERVGGLARDGDRLCIDDPAGLDLPTRAQRLADRLRRVDGRPVLTHGDLFPGNLLVDDAGAVTGLLDWGNAHVTTAGYALARAEMRFVDWFRLRLSADECRRLRTALRTGYRRHRPLPPEYPGLAGAYECLWLVQSVERHLRNLTTPRGRRQLRQHVPEVLSRHG